VYIFLFSEKMLNGTIISVAQMLTPLWSEQITKFFSLDYRYCTVFTLLFNGISTMITMSEETAIIILIAVFFSVLMFVAVNKRQTNFFSFFVGGKQRSIQFVTDFNSEKEHITNCITGNVLEAFLYDNPQFFTKSVPRWFFNTDSIRAARQHKMKLKSLEAFLEDGFYQVRFSDEIYFSIMTKTEHNEKKVSTRSFFIQFYRGTENDIFEFIKMTMEKKNVTTDKLIHLCPSGMVIGNLTNLCETKGKRNTFSGYYNPKLDMLLDWIDSLQKPNKCRQPRQFSILCHGKPGTGKTAIVKRIAEYTSRSIVCVDLFQIKKKATLMDLFHNGSTLGCLNYFHFGPVNELIFFIDEFDKVIRKCKLWKEEKKKKNMESSCVIVKSKISEKEDSDEKDKDADTYDWDIDDLLEIFCGSHIPDQRMIIATCNDLGYIMADFPYLVRPGRLTPIKFDHGKKDLFLRIVKDYADVVLDKKDIPEDFVFIQAHLIEYLNFKSDVTREEILKNLDMFRVK
jgi:hypothetical protein